ncbi:MAG: Trk system potassium transporter TrkA [Acidaminococcaceae bacterium]|nr:Trk system potassium transporter TrkA [Acidaminococcaceae bacterium]
MRIVVAGAGDLGFNIAKLLVADEFNVVLVEKSAQRCEEIQKTIDCLVLNGDVTASSLYQRQDVAEADLFVACTGVDEVNIVACTLAKHYGVQKTIVCVRNVDYSNSEKDFLRQDLHVDVVLNPCEIMALEISQVVNASSSLNVEKFADGKVTMFETKIGADSNLLNQKLRDMELPRDILAALITRNNKVLIPSGEDCLMPEDYVYFVGISERIEEFQKQFSEVYQKPQRIMIIGGGRTGQFLAPLLLEEGKDIKIIEKNGQICQKLAAELRGGVVLCGDGSDMAFLEEEGAGQADLIIVITDDDRLNLMTALVAKHLGTKRTLVRLTHSEYLNLTDKVEADVVLFCQMLTAAEVLRYAHRGEVVNVSYLGDSRVEAVEVVLGEDSAAQNRAVQELDLPKESLMCALVRGKEVLVPKGDTVLEAGDRLVILARNDRMTSITSLFEAKD